MRLPEIKAPSLQDVCGLIAVCSLDSLSDPVSPASNTFSERQNLMAADGEDHGRTTIRMYKAAARSLLSIRVLVQNRRKEKETVLVYGSKAQVVAFPSTNDIIQRGAAPLGENQTKFTRERQVLGLTPSCCLTDGRTA